MKIKPIFQWTLRVFLGVLLIAGIAIFIAYWRSTNDCERYSATPEHPMNAFVYCDYGDANVLALRQIKKPAPKDDEVLIKVRAVSVNPLDWHFMHGTPLIMRPSTGLRKPKDGRMGVDFSGVIEAVGTNVTNFKQGDEVFGGRDGAFAEYVTVRASKALALKPAVLDLSDAASLPIAGITALQCLRDTAKVQPGEKVLINGASGGVGTFAVQIAKSLGADVIGVCSGRNVELVRSLGADRVIDYQKEDFAQGTQRYDVIIDNVPNHSLAECRGILTPNGRYVMIGGGGPNDGPWVGPIPRVIQMLLWSPFVHEKMGMFLAQLTGKDLTALADLIQAGKMKPVIDRRYPFAQLPEAIRYLEEGHARGKIVITLE